MREIKFRAWHQPTQKMYQVLSIDFHSQTEKIYSVFLGFSPYTVRISDVELMQFIEKKDKNGKEVYDSDVLKSHEGILWRVQWNEEKAEFELAWCGGPQPVYYRHGLHLIKDTYCEIVGNIYENPELMRGGK